MTEHNDMDDVLARQAELVAADLERFHAAQQAMATTLNYRQLSLIGGPYDGVGLIIFAEPVVTHTVMKVSGTGGGRYLYNAGDDGAHWLPD